MLRVKDSMAIENGKGRKIAEVKRALITPFVQVAANQDDLLVLAVTVAIDAMVHPQK